MVDIKKMLQCELNFPRDFTNAVDTAYGVLFYNEDIADSHDSNHAVVYDLEADLDKVVSEIVEFYSGKGIDPRLYQSFQPEDVDILEPYLKDHGFTIQRYDNWAAIHSGKSTIKPVPELVVKRVTRVDEKLADMILKTENNNPRSLKVLKKRIPCENYHHFVGFHEGEPVSMAAFSLYDGFSEVDSVLTHVDHRGLGYCSTVIDEMCRQHQQLSKNTLYLWATDPVAIKIYKNAGFKHIEIDAPFWSAWKPI